MAAEMKFERMKFSWWYDERLRIDGICMVGIMDHVSFFLLPHPPQVHLNSDKNTQPAPNTKAHFILEKCISRIKEFIWLQIL